MPVTRLIAAFALALASLVFLPVPLRAAINEMRLGASVSEDGKTFTFAVYSAHATHIRLCLFASPQGGKAILTRDIGAPNGAGVW